jgi:histone acetyltransferase
MAQTKRKAATQNEATPERDAKRVKVENTDIKAVQAVQEGETQEAGASDRTEKSVDDSTNADVSVSTNAPDMVDKLEEENKEEIITSERKPTDVAPEAFIADIEPETEVDDEEKRRLHTFQFDGFTYSYKDRPSVLEEVDGKIEFRVVNNDNTYDNMILLTGLKNIFQKQLPEMPKAYIARLVYDRSHVSVAVVRHPLTVVGGITIRPFESHEFAEIVFCAISSTEQVRGYGAHLMNHLKDYVLNTTKIRYFLTYADNYAIGYFKKQGFTKDITLPKHVWMGYIKDYEGGTLMQCTMLSKIRYLDSNKILSVQRAAIMRKIRSIGKSHIVHKGLDHFRKEGFTPLNASDIPGIKEAGWTQEMDDLAQKPKRGAHHIPMLTILTEMQNHPSNWPFVQPVSRTDVPDYYEVIKEPMDLSTMEVKLENDAYESMDDFIYDCKLIFNNCRAYNGENTTFYKNANKLEKAVIAKLKDFPEYSSCLDILTKR